MTRQHAHRLVEAAGVVGEITEQAGPELAPTTESQARELLRVEPERRVEVMREVTAQGPPSARAIRELAHAHEPNAAEESAQMSPIGDIGVDLSAEEALDDAHREIERLHELVESLTDSDLAVECAQWSERYARLEGRVRQLTRTAREAERTATYRGKLLREIRAALGVERDREILPALGS